MNRDKELLMKFINSPIFLESYDPLSDQIDAFLASDEYKALGEKLSFHWVCNQCNTPNYNASIDDEVIDNELLSCINCGGFEFHKVTLPSPPKTY